MTNKSAATHLTGILRGELKGLYTHRILRSVMESQTSQDRETILHDLTNAAATGDIHFKHRRWGTLPRGVTETSLPGNTKGGEYEKTIAAGGLLKAIPCPVLSGRLPDQQIADDATEKASLEGWNFFRHLTRHYRECLRLGGATSTSHFAEKHRQQFHLLDCRARWWPDNAGPRPLRIARSDLGGQFLEALSRRQSDPVLLGYPISVAILPDGSRIVAPVGILQCSWTIDDAAVTVEPVSRTPTLNNNWVGKMRERRDLRSTLRRLTELTEQDSNEVTLAGRESWDDIQGLGDTISTFLPHRLHGKQDPAQLSRHLNLDIQDDIQNVLGLFLVSDHPYTIGARNDLLSLEKMDDTDLQQTSLSAFFSSPTMASPSRSTSVQVLSPFEISEDQFLAVMDGLTQPLTVISGPPGTGKSQVAAALMVSAAAAGKSVLFSGRTHKSVDAVISRIDELSLDRPLVIQASGNEATGAIDFHNALDALISRLAETDPDHELDILLDEISTISSQTAMLIDLSDALTEQTNKLGKLWKEKTRREQAAASGLPVAAKPIPASSILGRLINWLTSFFIQKAQSPDPASQNLANTDNEFIQLTEVELDRRITATTRDHRAAQKKRDEQQATHGKLPDHLAGLIGLAREALPIITEKLDQADEDEIQRLLELLGNIGLARTRHEKLEVWRNSAEIVLRHFPVWASTTLSVPGRIPFVPALFDYVIIDEATTSDIASALPLLARARQCIIIGDRMQTGMVSDLDPGKESELLIRAGLDQSRTGRFSFTQISLFDLATGTPGARRHMLRDHFRCHPDIAGFISDTFYGHQLFVRTNVPGLHTPNGSKSGMHWTDITGPIEAAGNGSRSQSEAEAVVREIVTLIRDRKYEGTIGVVTPFKKQADLIIHLVEGRITDAERTACALIVGTAHAFQGDARDVVLVSLCYGSQMSRGSEWFIRNSGELLNVAVSRARAVCHIFGNRAAAESSSIRHIRRLAKWMSQSGQPDISKPPIFESPWETALHNALAKAGIETITQYPLAGRRLDLAVITPSLKLNIEVDGETFHRDRDGFRKASDIWRDHVVRSLGWEVRRFWVYELKENMEKCVERIRQDIANG